MMITETIILDLIEKVNNEFSYSKKINQNKDKCTRDMKFILEALAKDLEFETTKFSTRIANRFWYNGECQLKTSNTEIDVYNFILLKLREVLSDRDIDLIEKSVQKIIKIINNGPDIDDFGSQISQDVLKAEHCQRNWDINFKLPEEDLDALIRVATSMPTKQNRDYYKLIVSTDVNFNKKIYNLAADPDNPDTPSRNSQVAANALFIYVSNADFKNNNKKFKDDHYNNASVSVGISSGALTLAAAQMDYRTGFCQCFLNKEIKEELKNKGINNIDDEYVILLVGIGKPNPNHRWYSVVDENDEILKYVQTEKKTINVERI